MVEEATSSGARLSAREAAALTSRQWVRLARCCNNRCAFCLDSEAQDGTMCPEEEVLEQIVEGRRRGRRRLVLSGGEPTIHPSFLSFVRAGARAGYERVQVITNGRMLARPDFLEAAVGAGMGEVTLSIHGHTPELHDRLVGVDGAFAQTIRGLTNALKRRELVVNVDIVVCGPNVAVVDRIIALCRRLGVHEFDLLQVQPSGRAAQSDEMLYDVGNAMASLTRVFELSRQPELFLWTNRFPVPHLEGFEELIQDPHKLVDEIRGRHEHVEALLETGRPFPCRAVHDGRLCSACFLSPLCDELHDVAFRMTRGDFREALFDVRSAPPIAVPAQLGGRIRRSRVIARSLSDVRCRLSPVSLPGREVTLWLEEAADLEGHVSRRLEVGGLGVTRIASVDVDVLDAALKLEVDEVEVTPELENESWLREHLRLEAPRLVIRPAPRATLSECLEGEVPPRRLRDLLARSKAVVEDLPHCLAGGRPVTWTEPELPQELLQRTGPEQVEQLVLRFASARYRGKSLRCEGCVDDGTCRGQLVQRLRAFGLRSLEPRG